LNRRAQQEGRQVVSRPPKPASGVRGAMASQGRVTRESGS
jgi:hypothetical protein